MTVIFKKAFNFVDWRRDGQGQIVARQKHLVLGSPDGQTVPDWVSKTELFAAAVREGSALQVVTVPDLTLLTPVVAPPDSDQSEGEPKAETVMAKTRKYKKAAANGS
jgi:hypothetical protein